jgi:iron(III) transport system ATP-binding protein
MAVEIERVTKRFGEVVAVEGVSATIRDKAFVTFLGPSGCGKTTLLRLLAGFLRPDAGRIVLDGQVVSAPEACLPPERRGMGMVFQTFAVWPHMTVFENIAYGLRLRRLARREITERVGRALAMVKLEGLDGRYPSQLSGGQQQRVALARSIVVEPRILLLDEPLSNLDAKLRKEMWLELREIQRRVGIAFVYVTHDQAEALSVSDEIIVLNRGQVEQIGAPQEIYERPRTLFVASFLGAAHLVRGRVVAPESGLVEVEAGARLRCQVPSGLPPGAAVVVCVRPGAVTLGEGATGENVLEGTVEGTQYFGDTEEVLVRAGSLTLTAKGLPARTAVGTVVRARLDPDRCLAFPAD